MNTGDIAWRAPLGTYRSLEAKGVKNTGAPNLGGSIATAGGLVFIAATNDSRFRAFESKTGRLLWEQPIEANGHAIPITYLGKDGKQYVAIMAGGGGGFFGAPPSDSVMAFALDNGRRTEVSAAPSERPAKTSAPSGVPESALKSLLQQKCGGQCHKLEVVTSRRFTQREWKGVVDAMIARGATGSDREMKLIVEYLARQFAR